MVFERRYKHDFDVPDFARLRTELMGLAAAVPFAQHASASRLNMAGTQTSQHLTPDTPEMPLWRTGIESEFAETSYQITVPEDGYVVKIISLYGRQFNAMTEVDSPEVLIIFRSAENYRRFFSVILEPYSKRSKKFGFKYVKTPEGNSIRVDPNYLIKKDTVLARSPAILDGEYTVGNNPIIGYMTHPAVAEDGLMINIEYLKRCGYRYYFTATFQIGDENILLNHFGDENRYKMFPDIGERVGDDGVLAVVRSMSRPQLTPVERSRRGLMRTDPIADTTHHVMPGAKVIDIRVIRNSRAINPSNEWMERQLLQYVNGQRAFNETLSEWYRITGRDIETDHNLTNLIDAALASDVDSSKSIPVGYNYKGSPIDNYFIKIVLCADMLPGHGAKFADMFGGKGVACKIVTPEEMPRNEDGDVADIISCSSGTFNRNIICREYELTLSAASIKLRKSILKRLRIPDGMSERAARNLLSNADPRMLEECAHDLWDFWCITSPTVIDMYERGEIEFNYVEVLATFSDKPISYIASVENPVHTHIAIKMVNDDPRFCPEKQHLTFKTSQGRIVKTKEKFLLSRIHYMMLEKNGLDNSATAGAVLNSTGMPTRASSNDGIVNNNAIRAQGEDETGQTTANTGVVLYDSEGRILGADKTGQVIGDYIRINNNYKLHCLAVERLLTSDTPCDIEHIVDPEIVAKHSHFPSDLVNATLGLGGVALAREGDLDD